VELRGSVAPPATVELAADGAGSPEDACRAVTAAQLEALGAQLARDLGLSTPGGR